MIIMYSILKCDSCVNTVVMSYTTAFAIKNTDDYEMHFHN